MILKRFSNSKLPPQHGESKRGGSLSFYILPPHAKNTSPYYGEGDKGGEVGKPLIEASEAKRYTICRTIFAGKYMPPFEIVSDFKMTGDQPRTTL